MRFVCALILLSGGLALPAQADDDVLDLPAATLAESDQAEPDWYQRFTFAETGTQNLDLSAPGLEGAPSKTLNLAWSKGDRWTLSVDLTSRDDTLHLPREEMSAGAQFHITPRLTVGGELNIGTDEFDETGRLQDQQVETGIRLSSAFKF